METERLKRLRELAALIDRLPSLLDALQKDGFTLGAGEHAAAHRLLLRLAESGELPDDFRRLRSLLAPLLCASPEQQDRFARCFAVWLAETGPDASPETEPDPVGGTRQTGRFDWRKALRSGASKLTGALTSWLGAIPIAGLAVVAAVGFGYVSGWLLPLAGAILLAAVIRDIAIRIQVGRALRRGKSAGDEPRATFYTTPSAVPLFSPDNMRELAMAMRKPESAGTAGLDVPATVDRTVRERRFSPMPAVMRRTPEYLALIDRRSFRDHAAAWADALLGELSRLEAPVTRFYFDRDPRVCFPASGRIEPVRIEALIRRYPDDRLLLFADDAMVRTEADAARFPWKRRACFHLSASAESVPENAAFPVLPADESGLWLAVNHFNGGKNDAPRSRRSAARVDRRVTVADSAALRWNEPPPDAELERLVGVLREMMRDEKGWQWLCACAVYPELRWGITLHLWNALADEEEPGIFRRLRAYVAGAERRKRRRWEFSPLFRMRLNALVELPWFRHGAMPDWLRKRLINDDDFHGGPERRTRRILFRLLKGVGLEGTMALEAAAPPDAVIRRAARRMAEADTETLSPMRDTVFLNFMTDPLSMRLPREALRFIRKALRRREREAGQMPPVHPPPEFTNRYGMRFMYIPPGEFMMGSPEDEPERLYWEGPRHKVTLKYGFYMQETPVTQGQWEAVTGNNPSLFKEGGPECPVENVSWDDAKKFIKKLNKSGGEYEYRLPSEAEWEYACRAGTDTPFWTGRCLGTDQANYNGNFPLEGCPKGEYRKKTTPVKKFAPNPFGLYDMHGNVWEWCEDHFHGNYDGAPTDGSAWTDKSQNTARVLRGGSWTNYERNCRSASRLRNDPDYRDDNYGFRAVVSRAQY